MSGRVLDEDGNPLSGLAYGWASPSLRPTLEPGDWENLPVTQTDGAFTIPHLLPDEPYGFWILTDQQHAHVWCRLDPTQDNQQLVMRADEIIELPPSYKELDFLGFVASQQTHLSGDTINFDRRDLNGQRIRLEDQRFKNKVVTLNIWGTWCGQCMAEIPVLIDFQQRYRDQGLEVVGIAFERGGPAERMAALRESVEKLGINYPVIYGGEADKEQVKKVIGGLAEIDGYPTMFYIGRDGRVKHIQSGFRAIDSQRAWQIRVMEDRIKQLLAEAIE